MTGNTEAQERKISTDAERVLTMLDTIQMLESPRRPPIVRRVRAGEEARPSTAAVLNTVKSAMEKLAWGQWDLLTTNEADLLTGRTEASAEARKALGSANKDFPNMVNSFVATHRDIIGVTYHISKHARAVLDSYPNREATLSGLRLDDPLVKTCSILEKVAASGIGSLDATETAYLKHRAVAENLSAGVLVGSGKGKPLGFGDGLEAFVNENAETLDTLANNHRQPQGPLARIERSLARHSKNTHSHLS